VYALSSDGHFPASAIHLVQYNAMSTTYTIRIDRDTDRLVKQLAASRRVTRSEIVREALRQLVREKGNAPGSSVYDRTVDLIGSYRSGRGDLSSRTGEGFKKRLRARPVKRG